MRCLLPIAVVLTGCYFQKPTDELDGDLANSKHVDGVPAAEGHIPLSQHAPPVQVRGAQVQLSGRASYGGAAKGSLRVDVLRSEDEDGNGARMLSSTAVEADGSWRLEVPARVGRINLCGYLDRDDNGPSSGEPKVILIEAAKVKDDPIAELELVLQDDWDQLHPETLKDQHLAPAQVGPQPHPIEQSTP